MVGKTLDERFREGPPSRGEDSSRARMGIEEKRFVLWGLKEGWSYSDIAAVLGVYTETVGQFRDQLLKDPNTLSALAVLELDKEGTGGTVFQCLVCAARLNSRSLVDRHAFAHFFRGSDSDTASVAQGKSVHSVDPHMIQSSETSSDPDESEDPSTKGQILPKQIPLKPPASPPDSKTSVIPQDPDREEMLQVLRRLADLPVPTDTDIEQSGAARFGESPGDSSAPADADTNTDRPPDTSGPHSEILGSPNTRQGSPPLKDGAAKKRLQEDIARLRHGAANSRPTVDASREEPQRADGTDSKIRSPRIGLFTSSVTRPVRRWFRAAGAELQRRDMFGSMGGLKEATSVTIEFGAMKILSTRVLDVVDYRTVRLPSQLYSGGVVADPRSISRYLGVALAEMDGAHRRVYAAIPGYQSVLRRLDLPDVRDLDPKQVMPREAKRTLGLGVENSVIRWQRLPGRSRVGRWLLAAASDASYSAISTIVGGTGHKLHALEMRPFALTRAIGRPTMLGVFVCDDGCDVVVTRNWEPHTYQSVYWEPESVVETSYLVRRLVEIVENTIDLHNLQNPEISVTANMPMVVTGGEVERRAGLGSMLASSLGRDLAEGISSLNTPSGFPYHSFVVNVGLALWDI